MRVEIVYVHHNAFILKLPERAFLFDYPSRTHLPPGADAFVGREVAGARLFVVFSHSHEDHLNPLVAEVVRAAESVRFIVSDDVPDMFPEVMPEDPERSLVLAPDEEGTIDGVRARALESNDLGVAFILETDGLRIYFGGDLANWDWENLPDKARRESREFFSAALASVAAKPVDIAFSNVDKRLASLAGGPQAAQTLAPALFVPMHTFGDTTWLPDLADALAAAGQVFTYRQMGDRLLLELTPASEKGA